MDCPKCHSAMRLKRFGKDIAVHRCETCAGLWCPGYDLDALKRAPMIDVLDVGDAALGAIYDRVANIPCPACGTAMTAEQVVGQPHITIDSCKSCDGLFLDAGELKDLKHHTFGDWLKAIELRLWLP